MSRAVCLLFVMGLLFLGTTNPVHAASSNRNEVRRNLASNGWRVVWGKNFTEIDWYNGLEAIYESIATENPAPFLKWFSQTMEENFRKMEANLEFVTRADLEDWILKSLQRKQIITYRGFEIQAGFATYNRWERFVYDEPRTREVEYYILGLGWVTGFETYWVRVERRIPLPNWHQFYVRYRFAGDDAQPNSYWKLYLNNRSRQRIHAAIHYQNVDGFWDSKGWWTLEPGQQFLVEATRNRYFYTTAHNDGNTITWGNDKTFTVRGTPHKFSENFITLDHWGNWTVQFIDAPAVETPR